MKDHLTTQHLDGLLAKPTFVREPACKANTGRNTLLRLRYWIGTNIFMDADKANVHDKINARSMNIVPTLKPFVS